MWEGVVVQISTKISTCLDMSQVIHWKRAEWITTVKDVKVPNLEFFF